jgi:uncharacterized phage protein (TIGR01671 family)
VKELLFKVFDKERNEMSEPFPLGTSYYIFSEKDGSKYPGTMESMAFMLTNPDRFIIMQYTSKETFHDKKEKIFKDDYIKVTYGDVGEVVYHVDWEDMDCGFIFVNIKDKTDRLLWWQIETNDMAESIEILGNVHEHKHLLEAADGN